MKITSLTISVPKQKAICLLVSAYYVGIIIISSSQQRGAGLVGSAVNLTAVAGRSIVDCVARACVPIPTHIYYT